MWNNGWFLSQADPVINYVVDACSSAGFSHECDLHVMYTILIFNKLHFNYTCWSINYILIYTPDYGAVCNCKFYIVAGSDSW